MLNDYRVNILLVEDDEVDALNIKRVFQKNQIQNALYTASNGLEALAMLRRNGGRTTTIPVNRRLILLDLNLPQMNGLEFLQALRADAELRAIPVVVLTMSDREQDLIQAYDYHVAGYLIKPVDLSDLTELLTTLSQYWGVNEMV